MPRLSLLWLPNGGFLIPSFLLYLLVGISVYGRAFSSLPSFFISLFPFYFFLSMSIWIIDYFIYFALSIYLFIIANFEANIAPFRASRSSCKIASVSFWNANNILWIFLLSDTTGWSMLILYFFLTQQPLHFPKMPCFFISTGG